MLKLKVLILLGLLTGGLVHATNSFTTHYNLVKPQDGDTNWGSGYRSNLDILDTDLFATASSITNHINATSLAHPATAISSVVGINVCTAASNVQLFLSCLDSAVNSIVGGGAASLSGNNTFTGSNTFTSSMTLSALGTGVVHSNSGGLLSSSAVALASDVSGTLPHGNGGTDVTSPGAMGNVLTSNGTNWTSATPTNTGTVTAVSVIPANGLAGTVATSTTTPAITLSTTITGLLQGNGTAISAATTTGSGSSVLATSPTLVTPALGTPTALVLTSATGLPLSTGVTGTLQAGQFPALTGDVTSSGGSLATTLAATTNGTIASLTKSTGVAIHGTNTNDAASAGNIGEFISANPGSPVTPAASGSQVNLCSISLTAGDWDVEGTIVWSNGTSTASTLIFGGASTTTGAFDSTNLGGYFQIAPVTSTYMPMGRRRLSLSTTTTVFLVAGATYASVGTATWGVGSFISARRVR